jgi:hypothetical protein
MFVDLASAGPNEDGIVAGATNVIPLIQANFSKDNTPVFPWMNNMAIKFLDLQKIQNTGRGLNEVLQTGLQTNWNKTLDKLVYTGFTSVGITGLINDARVTAASVANSALNPNGVSGAALKLWKNKTPDEVLQDFNDFLTAAALSAQYSESDLINTILMSWENYAYLVSVKVSSAGNCSLLTYLLDNNIVQKRGINLQIKPCRQCFGAGASGVNRMVGYVQRKDRLQFDITVPLSKGMTEASAKDVTYYTNFFGFFSALQLKYLQTIRYADGM